MKTTHAYIEKVQALHVEHLRTCEKCNDVEGLFCLIARQRAEVLNAHR